MTDFFFQRMRKMQSRNPNFVQQNSVKFFFFQNKILRKPRYFYTSCRSLQSFCRSWILRLWFLHSMGTTKISKTFEFERNLNLCKRIRWSTDSTITIPKLNRLWRDAALLRFIIICTIKNKMRTKIRKDEKRFLKFLIFVWI